MSGTERSFQECFFFVNPVACFSKNVFRSKLCPILASQLQQLAIQARNV
jgi:hypothetical protein